MHHRTKSGSITPTKVVIFEEEGKRRFLLRSFPLLLLMVFAAASVLRLGSQQSPVTLSHPSSSFFAGEGKDIESLRTHISANKNHFKTGEESQTSATLSCSALIDGKLNTKGSQGNEALLCCDRSHYRTDVCYLKGDIRTDPSTSSILLYGSGMETKAPELIRPYTRKWETSIMSTIDELTLQPMGSNNNVSIKPRAYDVRHHGVPAVVFSTGGYTGNVYHEFNDGLLPLFITAQRFGGEVVFVLLEYHSWWATKYRSVVEKMSNYKLVDFRKDGKVHCFSEMIVGLKIHGELTIDSRLMSEAGKGIQDFQSVLARAFSTTKPAPHLEAKQPPQPSPQLLPCHRHNHNTNPKLIIFIRNKSRVLLNLKDVLKACRRIGFDVRVLNPKRTTPLSDIYASLNSADVMLAVHGAAVTHFLFMRPSSVLMQVVPLGLDWAADTYYGEPARKLGLEYMEYKVTPQESSLSHEYDRHDPVLVDPLAITSKGWDVTKKIYLDKQNVRVDINKFTKLLSRAFLHVCKSHARYKGMK